MRLMLSAIQALPQKMNFIDDDVFGNPKIPSKLSESNLLYKGSNIFYRLRFFINGIVSIYKIKTRHYLYT